jgi:hypothetical protein
VSVTVVSEQAASQRAGRPDRAQPAPQNADSLDSRTADTENPAAETPEFGDFGLLPGSFPAGSPAPAEAPQDNHRVPFRNSDFNPFILPQDGGSGFPAKGRRGTEDDEEADNMV